MFLNNEYMKQYHSEYIQSNIKIIKDIDEELQLWTPYKEGRCRKPF